MTNFYVDVIQRDSRFHSPNAVNDMALLEPAFRAKVATLMAASKTAGIELRVTETYRSCERQQQLFAQGLTQLRTVGVHHYGLAADFCKIVGGQAVYDGDWTFLCRLAAALDLVAGGDWGEPDKPHSFRDWDHVQGCTVAEQTGLFAGTWYPGAAAGAGPLAPVPAASPIVQPARSAPGPLAQPLTSAQASIVTMIDSINNTAFAGWYWRSSVMAFVETESDFDTKAYRKEPSGVASYGLMQVLDATAAELGLAGDPAQLYDPNVGLLYGMKYAAIGWNYLALHLGRQPTIDEWVAGYNEGYGAAAQGRPDPGYVATWRDHQKAWLTLDPPEIRAKAA